MKSLIPYVLILLTTLVTGSFAEAREQTASQLIADLERQKAIIHSVEDFLLRPDLARMTILIKANDRLIETIGKNDLLSLRNMRALHEYIITYRYSQAFFREIESPFTSKAIHAIVKIASQIEKANHFDDSVYTQYTSNIFQRMHELVLMLLELPAVSAELKSKLQALAVPMGHLIAVGRNGDQRPETFEAGRKVYYAVEALYPDLYKLASSKAFDLTLEIQGLNELYAEYVGL